MKTLRTLNNYPPGSLMNPAFRYVRSEATDVARTFARVRRQQARQAQAARQPALPMPAAVVVPLRRRSRA